MGIFKEECYGVQCDWCNEVHIGTYTGYSVFVDECSATESAYEDDWKEIDGKWYCPECVEKLFHYDEGLDKYVPNKKSAIWTKEI